MPAFVVVNVEVRDQETYRRYIQLAPRSIAAYGGRYIARGGACHLLEGTYQPKRFVIVEFPSAERAREWWASPEYAEAKALRNAAATTDMVLVDGLPPDVAP